jgi:hypothetical protein
MGDVYFLRLKSHTTFNHLRCQIILVSLAFKMLLPLSGTKPGPK